MNEWEQEQESKDGAEPLQEETADNTKTASLLVELAKDLVKKDCYPASWFVRDCATGRRPAIQVIAQHNETLRMFRVLIVPAEGVPMVPPRFELLRLTEDSWSELTSIEDERVWMTVVQEFARARGEPLVIDQQWSYIGDATC